ncbi:MAG: prenyltransferase/squalene oxidase repeat-containing protein [Planctomycetota bacterium]
MRTRWCVLVVLMLAGSMMLVSCGQEEQGRQQGRGGDTGAVKPDIRGSIENAVAFLRAAQHKDGGWGARGSGVGITGLVIEALAGIPEDIRKKNADLIEKGVKYILANRRKDGSIVNEDGMVANYRTSIATRALIAIDREKYKDTIDAAVKYTKGIQGTDPNDKAKFGSMGYGSDKTKGDIINTAEALEMLEKAGVSKDDDVWKRAMVFLSRTHNSDEDAEAGVKTANDGGAIYRSVRDVEGASKAGTIKLPDGTEVPRSYGGATYALLKSLLFAGMKKDHPRVQAAYKWICDHYTVKEHPELGQQGLYYFYFTMVRTLELWGDPTIKQGAAVHNWAEQLAAQIISLQKKDGSWTNPKDKWWESDPALVSAYCIFSLNSCQRMLEK